MNFFEKRRLKSMLQSCNYRLAGEVIQNKFFTETGQNALNDLIQAYKEDPGFEEAVKLIDYEPQLTIYFVECNPDGFYSRQMQKRLIDTQEHQAFVAHLTGADEEDGFRQSAVAAEPATERRGAAEVTLDVSPQRKKGYQADEPLSGNTAKSPAPEAPAPLAAVLAYPNVIQTLRDSVRELEMQIAECEREIAQLDKRGATQADMRRKWLSLCKEGVREFESAIRVLQSYEKQ